MTVPRQSPIHFGDWGVKQESTPIMFLKPEGHWEMNSGEVSDHCHDLPGDDIQIPSCLS